MLHSYTMDQGLPSDWVRAAVQDDVGFMWFATAGGLTRFDGYTFRVFPYQYKDSLAIKSDPVQSLAVDNDGFLWILRYNFPLERFNPKTETSVSYPSNSNNLPTDMNSDIFFDPPHHLWIGHAQGGGVSRLNKDTGEIVNFQVEPDSLEKRVVWDVHRDEAGDLWVATDNGLYLFDSLSTNFIRYTYQDLYPNAKRSYYENINDLEPGKLLLETAAGPLIFDKSSKTFQPILDFEDDNYSGVATYSVRHGNDVWISNSSSSPFWEDNHTRGLIKYTPGSKTLNYYELEATTPLCLDRSGNIWVESPNNGISSFNPRQRKFLGYKLSEVNEKFTHIITAICQNHDGLLWLATTKGLYLFEFDSQKRLQLVEDFTKKIGPAPVSYIYEDSKSRLWIGTSDGLFQYMPEKHRFQQQKFSPAIDDLSVTGIYEDKDGKLWVSGPGLAVLDPSTETFIIYDFESTDNILQDIEEDLYETLWLQDGLNLWAFDKERKRFYTFEVPNSNYLGALFIDQSNRLWLGTDIGLYSLELKPLGSLINEPLNLINYNHLISLNFIQDIEGHNNDLWISRPEGLLRINTVTQEVKTFDRHDGLYNLYTSSWNSFKNNQGELIFTWEDRFNIFHPDSISYNDYIPPLVLTDFKISSRSVSIGDSLERIPLLNQAIYQTKSVTLPPNQTFSFEFSALDYTNPKENQYSYMLEGLDKEWSTPDTKHTATYTSLWEGDYTFRVIGSNSDGVWNEVGTSIKITVLPPWWRTWWAYCFYALIAIGILWSFFRFFIIRERLKGNLKLEQVELEKVKEMDQAKTQFFANISHEFRTPLTLILGPLKQMKGGTFKGDVDTVINVMVRNSQRLLRLINQLLDVSKLEAGAVSLQVSVGDLVEFTRTMFSAFESTAKNRGLDYSFQSNVSTLPAYYDREKLEKVIINLLSNAFKFTSKGTINLRMRTNIKDPAVDKGEGIVEISIEDSGRGIPPEQLPHIFDRFFQADSSFTRHQEGTGIGLALAKELVELHYGTIKAFSKKGEGSIFAIHLPLGKSYLQKEELAVRKGYQSIDNTDIEAMTENITIPSVQDHQSGDLPLLLIIDDNEDMRLYLREILSETYQVAEASNGLTGWDYALNNTPDLIISDVMMPEMDGHQLCEQLKTDERTSHIPVVLLTARAGEEAKLEGLETGADDYITKPFSPVELKARVQNLIELRQKLREQFGRNLSQQPKDVAITSMDERFLQRALDILEIHRSDTDFNSDAFALEIGMSRSQLHRKLKALTDQSTGDLIRSYRLKYARQLIEKDFGNITQVAYECGYSSPSHFAENFKKQFGVTPSEFSKMSEGLKD